MRRWWAPGTNSVSLESLDILGDSRTPPVSHWCQTQGSILPCEKSIQQSGEASGIMHIRNNIQDPLRCVGEDRFQRITGGQNPKSTQMRLDKTATHDLSSAQNVSSSTYPPRYIYHASRRLAPTAWRGLPILLVFESPANEVRSARAISTNKFDTHNKWAGVPFWKKWSKHVSCVIDQHKRRISCKSRPVLEKREKKPDGTGYLEAHSLDRIRAPVLI